MEMPCHHNESNNKWEWACHVITFGNTTRKNGHAIVSNLVTQLDKMDMPYYQT
jgi:hypothetical protein